MSHSSPPQFRPYRTLVAGFCASTASALVLLFAHIAAQVFARGMGEDSIFHALAYNTLTSTAGSNLYLAVLFHFTIGIVFAAAYAKMVGSLPGHNSWKSGLIFSLGLWLLSAMVFFPLVGADFFGVGLGAGLLPVAGSLILHMVYGSTLGLLYSPSLSRTNVNPVLQRSTHTQRENAHGSDKAAAMGILGGTGIGVAVVTVVGLLVGNTSQFAVPGLPLDFTLMSVVFFCSAMGMLVGFWTGNPERRPQTV